MIGHALALAAPAPRWRDRASPRAARRGRGRPKRTSCSSAAAIARPEAMARFVEWAGGPAARVLVVPWASGEPKESCDAILDGARAARSRRGGVRPVRHARRGGQGRAARPGEVEGVSRPPGRRDGRLLHGRGPGARHGRARRRDAARGGAGAATRRASSFGGTSAGTAVMSATMITGEGDFTVIDGAKVGVRPGLGLLERRDRRPALRQAAAREPAVRPRPRRTRPSGGGHRRGHGAARDRRPRRGGRRAGPVLLVDARRERPPDGHAAATGQQMDLQRPERANPATDPGTRAARRDLRPAPKPTGAEEGLRGASSAPRGRGPSMQPGVLGLELVLRLRVLRVVDDAAVHRADLDAARGCRTRPRTPCTSRDR